MKKRLKKAAAAVLAVILAASLCGCDRGYIMTVDGMEIRNGVYLSFMRTAYGKAQTEFKNQSEETSDPETSESETSDTTSEDSVPITKKEISGKSGSQWIKDETLKYIRRFVAVQRKCEELGIELTEEETAKINTDVTSMWDSPDDMIKYLYDFETIGEYYENIGISRESYKQISTVSELQTKLFMYYYDKGGEFEIKDSEVDAHLKDKFVSVKYMSVTYTDASGKTLENDSDKKALRDNLQKYADRINKGDKPKDVFYDYSIEKATERAKAKAETEYKEDNEDKLTKEEWIKKQVEAAGIKKYESDDDLDQIISKDNTSLDEKLKEYIINAESDGKAKLFDTEKTVYLVIKEDITQKTKWKEENRDNVLTEMKSEEFQSMMDIFGQNYEVDANESLVNNKYRPERLDP